MGNITGKLKAIGGYFLILAVGYLLFRVYAVTGERDHARALAGAYKNSSEQFQAALGKLGAMESANQKILTLWEKQNGEIMLARSSRQQAVTEEARKNTAFAAWRGVPLPALYLHDGGLLGLRKQAGNYTDAGFRQSRAPGQPHGPSDGAGMERQN